MQYKVIFDFLNNFPVPLSFCLVFVGMICGVFLKWLRSINKEERQSGIQWFCGVLLLGGSGVWAMQHANGAMRDEYRAGRYLIITGNVTNLRSGFKSECFNVEQVQFCYNDFVETGGFNHTVKHGGPIREGLPVRISYMTTTPTGNHNVILRLEVQKI